MSSGDRLSLLSVLERNVLLLARRTASDWPLIARELHADPEACRAAFQTAKTKLEGRPTTPQPEGSEHMPTDQLRSTDDVLTDALAELEARRDKLLPLVDELKQTERAIATLQRATGQKPAPKETNGGRAASGATRTGPARNGVPDHVRDKIVAALDTDGPTEIAAIAQATGIGKGPYLYGVLNQLTEASVLAKVNGGYAQAA